MRVLMVVMVLVLAGCAGPGPGPLECGAGTVRQGTLCIAAPPERERPDAGDLSDAGGLPDAGLAAELPGAAIIRPVTVMEGFAVCPDVTTTFSSGRNATLLLDPTYLVPVPDALPIQRAGFSVSWEGDPERVGSVDLPTCRGAIVARAPGTTTVSLRVTSPSGASRIIGSAAVTVVPLATTGAGPALRLGIPNGTVSTSEARVVGVGEVRLPEVSFELQFPQSTRVDRAQLPVPEFTSFTSSDSSVLAIEAGTVRALKVGTSTLSFSYRVRGRLVGATDVTVRVSDSQAVESILFGLPLADTGVLFPDSMRTLDTLEAGTCFTTSAWAVVTVPEGTFLRRVDPATGLTASAGLVPSGPGRFCSTAPGDFFVTACWGGRCDRLGVAVVETGAVAPTLRATVTPSVVNTGRFGPQTLCVDLRVTAKRGTGPEVDVTNSPALRFARPFASPLDAMTVIIDPASGAPERSGAGTCFTVDVVAGRPDISCRVFYAGAQAVVALQVKF